MRNLLAALALFIATTPAPARAADAHALVQRGIQLYREASYASSVASLEQARQARSLDGLDETELAFYLAADYVALGSMPAARRELKVVLESQPGYELPPYTSPKVSALFRDVRAELERSPRLRALPPRRTSPMLIELWFDPSRTGGTAYGSAMWRWHGETGWREAPLSHVEDKLVTTIAIDRDGALEYWAEARGPQGLAQAASAARPLELPVTGYAPSAPSVRPLTAVALAPSLALPPAPPARPEKSVARAWWLWTTVGAVVAAGAGVGLYFALRPGASGTSDAALAMPRAP